MAESVEPIVLLDERGQAKQGTLGRFMAALLAHEVSLKVENEHGSRRAPPFGGVGSVARNKPNVRNRAVLSVDTACNAPGHLRLERVESHDNLRGGVLVFDPGIRGLKIVIDAHA